MVKVNLLEVGLNGGFRNSGKRCEFADGDELVLGLLVGDPNFAEEHTPVALALSGDELDVLGVNNNARLLHGCNTL